MTTAMPAPSMGAFYALTTALDAAIVARETTGAPMGRDQSVSGRRRLEHDGLAEGRGPLPEG